MGYSGSAHKCAGQKLNWKQDRTLQNLTCNYKKFREHQNLIFKKIYFKSANGTTWYLNLSQYMDRYALQAILRRQKITSTQVP
jgi:hypothetical protein